jgi:methylated-DNA-[protein]-cysteine S-methyltransferase
VGKNPLGVIVPCHRVIGSSGALTGFAAGLERKTALLELEGAWFARPAQHTLFEDAA